MKRVNKNIAFNYSNIIKIEKYAKDNSLTFTSAVNEMIDNTPYDKNLMNLIDKNIAHNKAVTNLIYELLK